MCGNRQSSGDFAPVGTWERTGDICTILHHIRRGGNEARENRQRHRVSGFRMTDQFRFQGLIEGLWHSVPEGRAKIAQGKRKPWDSGQTDHDRPGGSAESPAPNILSHLRLPSENLLQRKGLSERSRRKPASQRSGVLAERMPPNVRRKGPPSAVCRPQCSRLLKQPGRA